VLGVLGFALALVLALLKAWETFWQKPNLTLDVRWHHRPTDGTVPYELYVDLANLGRRRDTAREIGFAKQKGDEDVRVPNSIDRQLPKVMDVDTVVRFKVGILAGHENETHREFHQGMIDGVYSWVYVLDAHNEPHWFEVPPRTFAPTLDLGV
jgi:hypothetical protein